jgi:hypothetical protein
MTIRSRWRTLLMVAVALIILVYVARRGIERALIALMSPMALSRPVC